MHTAKDHMLSGLRNKFLIPIPNFLIARGSFHLEQKEESFVWEQQDRNNSSAPETEEAEGRTVLFPNKGG